eukprot:908052-Lingulodinium_polyedra.AAC.1
MRQNAFSRSVESRILAGASGLARELSSACRAQPRRQRTTRARPVGLRPCWCGSTCCDAFAMALSLAMSSASLIQTSASVTGRTFL